MSSGPPLEQRFFSDEEFALVTALVERLLPDDGFGPSGVQAGVPLFIDAQLCGRLGRAPSTVPGATFAQAFRAALSAMQTWIEERHGTRFQSIPANTQDDLLRFLETAAEPSFAYVPPYVFFETLLNLAKAGYLQNLGLSRPAAQAHGSPPAARDGVWRH
jgi:gluconate 2-dehydrogenase gamma chain